MTVYDAAFHVRWNVSDVRNPAASFVGHIESRPVHIELSLQLTAIEL